MPAVRSGNSQKKRSGSPARRPRRSESVRRSGPVHPGTVLQSVLEDTPPAAAAAWFGLKPDEFTAVLEGRAPMTPDLCSRAGEIFGTGAAPWLDMQAAWEESQSSDG